MSKVRTIVSLDAYDKRWADAESKRRGISLAELFRIVIRRFREHTALGEPRSFDDLLSETSGIWSGEDGLSYQESMRSEWER